MIQIGKGPRGGGGGGGGGGVSGVVPRLLDCHERIRRFTGHAATLGEDTPATDAEVREAAAQVLSYFEKALPRHSADEDDSVAPRLPGVPEVADMKEQHVDIHATLDELIPLWRQLVDEPGKREIYRTRLGLLAGRLRRLFDVHLELEESTIFPAIEKLPAAVQDEIIEEMVARRQE